MIGQPISRASNARTFKKTIGAFLLACLCMGCENEISPFSTIDFPYTIWGIVNPQADTQAVRVFTIDTTLDLVPSQSLDAVASIIEVENEIRHVLVDSVTQLPSGDFRHTFWSEFEVQHGELYRVEVERSDGLVTRSSDIRVPNPITILAPEPNEFQVQDLIIPVLIEGNPPSMPRIDANYDTFSIDRTGVREGENPVTVSYVTKPRLEGNTWVVDINLLDDFLAIREDFNANDLQGQICMDGISIEIHVGNEEWRSPIGVFDPNVLVEPGTLSNVENGFGFFGAGFVESIQVFPPLTMQVRAGFFDCAGA